MRCHIRKTWNPAGRTCAVDSVYTEIKKEPVMTVTGSFYCVTVFDKTPCYAGGQQML